MITTGITVSSKVCMLELLAKQDFKLALYSINAELDCYTAEYTPTNEARGKGYKAGGLDLENPRVWVEDEQAYLTWDSPVIPVSTLSANGFMIYCPTMDNRSIFIGSWNATYTSTEGPFTINISPEQVCLS